MRILLAVHQFMPEFRAGTETLTLRTAQELQRRGHHVCVLTAGKFAPDLPHLHRYSWSGLSVIRLNVPEPEALFWGRLDQTFRRSDLEPLLRRVLIEVQPELVHIFHLRRLTLAFIDLLRVFSMPIVLSITDYWFGCFTGQMQYPLDQPCAGPDARSANCLRHLASRLNPAIGRVPMPIWTLLMRSASIIGTLGPAGSMCQLSQRQESMQRAYAEAQRVLVPSGQLYETFRGLGFDLSRTTICPYGIDLSGLESLPPRTTWLGGSDRPLEVAFVGTLNHAKGAHVLLEAVARLPSWHSFNVRIYGDAEEGSSYGEMIKAKERCVNNVTLAGVFAPDQVFQVLASVDVLVVPSLWRENSPLILLQAIASGLPVLASDVAGMADHIHAGVNGELFAPGNSEALAQLLEYLMTEPRALAAMTMRQARPRTICDYVDQVESVYRELL